MRQIKKIVGIFILIVLIFNHCCVLADENVTDSKNYISYEQYFDIFQMLRISGSAEERYYYEFKTSALNQLNQLYSTYKSSFNNAGITSVDTLKEYIKAQAASELPDLGGIVTSEENVSDGTETDITQQSVLTAIYDDTGTSSSSGSGGDFIWPIVGQDTAEDRGNAILSGAGNRGLAADSANGGVHQGLDIVSSLGESTEICAIADGTVQYAGAGQPHVSFGNGIIIDHGEINGEHFVSEYAHLSKVLVSPGDTVTQGQVIGYMGQTGNAYGIHLHFGIWKDAWWQGDWIDPLEIYSSDYVNGTNYQGTGTYATGYASTSTTTSSTSAKFSTTKDTTKAMENLLNSNITVNINESTLKYKKVIEETSDSISSSYSTEQVINGGVKIRRITPNKSPGEEIETDKSEVIQTLVYENRGTAQMLPDRIARALGLNREEYSLLSIPYIDFEENIHNDEVTGIGKMIVKTEYADEVLDIFYYLFANKYPIEKMYLPQLYSSDYDIDDRTIGINSRDMERIKDLCVINDRTMPSEGSDNYTYFINQLYEEVYVYYSTFLENTSSSYSGTKYDDDGEYTSEYKAFLKKIAKSYNDFKNNEQYLSQFQEKKAMFDTIGEVDEKTSSTSAILQARTENVSGSLEDKNILDNNTYGYIDTNEQSSTGLAITINPYYNPEITNGTSTIKQLEKYATVNPSSTTYSIKELDMKILPQFEVLAQIEELGWIWQGPEDVVSSDEEETAEFDSSQTYNLGRFVKKVEEQTDETNSKENEQKVMETSVFDLSYVSYKTFNSYLEQGDPRVLYCYTIGPDGYIYVASWEYNNVNGTETIKYKPSSPITFYKSLYKYEMSVELLMALLITTQDYDFTNSFAQLGRDSTYILAIEDQVSLKTTTNSSTGTSSIQETVDQIQEVLYVNNWFTSYIKVLSGESGDLEDSQLYSPTFIYEPITMKFLVTNKITVGKSSTSSLSSSSSDSNNLMIEAAEKVHSLLEEYNFQYSSSNCPDTVYEGVEDPEKRVSCCTTYVNWVLQELGLKLPNLSCAVLATLLPEQDWIEEVDKEDMKAGDIVLFSNGSKGHIQIYAGKDDNGNDLWYHVGGPDTTSDSAPNTSGLPFVNDFYPLAGVFRVKSADISSSTSTTASTGSIEESKIKYIGDSWMVGLEQTGITSSDDFYAFSGASAAWDQFNLDTVVANIGDDVSAIVCNLGLNNASASMAEKTAELLKGIAQKTGKPVHQLKTPHVSNLYTYANYVEYNKLIDEYNSKLESLIADIDNVYFIDATEKILGDNGLLKTEYATSDGLHLNSNEAYSDWINTALAKILSGDYGTTNNLTTQTTSYTYSDAKTYTKGNSENFVKIYNNASSTAKENLKSDWLDQMVNKSSNTYNMQYVMNYLVYQADNVNNTSTTLKWSQWKPDELQARKQSHESFDTDIDEKLLFWCGVLNEGACEGAYDLGDKYGYEVLNDNAGNTTAFGLTSCIIDSWVQENYPSFSDELRARQVTKTAAQAVYIHTMEKAKNTLVGEDEQGGRIQDPSILTQNELNALLDNVHNTGASENAGSAYVIGEYNTKGYATMEDYINSWGSNQTYKNALIRRSTNRGYLALEGIWVCYTMTGTKYDTGAEIEFLSETPFTDFCNGTPSSELYQVIG